MTEKEIRGVLRSLCADLDRRARKAARAVVLPAVLGAGLSGCSATPDYGAPFPNDHRVDDLAQIEQGVDSRIDLGPAPEYAAVFDGGVDGRVDSGPAPEYAAVFDGGADSVDSGPQVDYMAPDAKSS